MLLINLFECSYFSLCLFSTCSCSLVTDDFSMNAVMRLNQYRPGLDYKLTSQTGPVHEPVFTMAVDINGKTYESTGPSKRAAKLNVATKARLFVSIQVVFNVVLNY